jgi:hypothetical protein
MVIAKAGKSQGCEFLGPTHSSSVSRAWLKKLHWAATCVRKRVRDGLRLIFGTGGGRQWLQRLRDVAKG